MPRRSSGKATAGVSYSELDEAEKELRIPNKKTIKPRKQTKRIKEEEVDISNIDHDTTKDIKDTLSEVIANGTVEEDIEFEKEEEVKEKEENQHISISKKSTSRKRAQPAKKVSVEATNDTKPDKGSSTTKGAKETTTKKSTTKRELISDGEEIKPAKKPRKTKEEKEAEMLPLASRTAINTLTRQIYIGAHVSASGGVDKSIGNALHIGANAFALFLRSQRKWTSPPLIPEARDQFRSISLEKEYDATKFVLPHGSYLVNLAAKDQEKADQAYACFLDDLNRCEELGVKLYNFHPGNTNGEPKVDAIGRIAAQLNKAHQATATVVTLLETMAGQGNTVGSTFEDLRDIIALVDKKERVGICLDTCHVFAAGYDLRTSGTFDKTMDDLKEIVGIENLKAVHLNDSKTPFNSHRDLHANIGTGFLGLRAFHSIVNSPLFENMPIILETPIDTKNENGKSIEDKSVWAKEIKLLEGLIGMDAESQEFKFEEKRLWDAGTSERVKFQGQADKKQKKLDGMFKKVLQKKEGKKKKKKDEDSGDESEVGCNH